MDKRPTTREEIFAFNLAKSTPKVAPKVEAYIEAKKTPSKILSEFWNYWGLRALIALTVIEFFTSDMHTLSRGKIIPIPFTGYFSNLIGSLI